MGFVRGENVLTMIRVGGELFPYACALSVNISIDTELIETSTTGTGVNRTYLPTANTFAGTLTGLVNLDKPGMVTMPQLISFQLGHVLLNMKFVFTDEDGNTFVFNGDFYITNTSAGADISDAANFSVQVKGTGVPATSNSPITPIITKVMRKEFTLVEGQTSITLSDLENKDIIEAIITRLPFDTILTGGETPIDDEIVYDIVTGTFSWSVPAAEGNKGYIIYQDL